MLLVPTPQQNPNSLPTIRAKLPATINHALESRTQTLTTHHKDGDIFLRQRRLRSH
jgi:hypothetical protein